MKVKNLIKQLQTLNPESEIYQSIDSEGNEYKVIDQVAITELGDFIPCKETTKGATEIRKSKFFKWKSKGKIIVIFPTDEVIS